jgi:Zn-finger in ubiquitin-hydrolases and other protein
MTQAAHPWSFFQVVASQMDGARDDRVMYSRFVPALLRQVDPGLLHVMSYSPLGEYNSICSPPVRSGSSTTTLIHRSITGKEKLMAKQCTHLDQIRDVTPSANGCEDCLKIGDTWVHLRECLICGHVGCCDSSKNKHATKHFHATHHPIIQSFQPGEDWRWCYVDQVMF